MPSSWIAAMVINHLKFLGWTGQELMLISTANIGPLFHVLWKS
jgi:hypothetical protein